MFSGGVCNVDQTLGKCNENISDCLEDAGKGAVMLRNRNGINGGNEATSMCDVVRDRLRKNVVIICAIVIISLSAAGQSQAPPPPTSPTAPPDLNSNSPTTLAAQEPSGQDSQGAFVFKKQVQEIILHATVLDEQRHLVPGLDKSAFSVFQNGVPQIITSFRREDVPVAMGIVVDNSGSMRDKRDKVNQAVMSLIRASNPQDEIFVVNFSEKFYLDQDFTSNVDLLQASLHQLSMKGSTALYDAIVASAIHLKNNRRLDKRVLLVITDGRDNMSQETLQEAARRLQQIDGPTLYSIALTGVGRGPGRKALQDLADRTGGVAYFPDSLDQIDSIASEIARDVRSQYVVAYKPKDQSARPSYQSIRVEARAKALGHLTVRTRSGYTPEEK
jgi:VWFA-related protein